MASISISNLEVEELSFEQMQEMSGGGVRGAAIGGIVGGAGAGALGGVVGGVPK